MSGNIPTATQWTRDATDNKGKDAIDSVYLITSSATNSKGTGFLHNSGYIITNHHVVEGSPTATLTATSSNDNQVSITNMTVDAQRDLAALTPSGNLSGGLDIASSGDVDVGTQVSTWGHPLGYSGPAPILSVGYLAGYEQNQYGTKQFTVNGAFNGGNSGGPLFASGTNGVVGVVVSKHAPFTPFQQSALTTLANQQSGFMYTATDQYGNSQQFTEAQIVADVLSRVVDLTQVMIGHAIATDEVKAFIGSL